MTSVYELICSVLEELGYAVREQGSYGEEESLPETYVTYFVLEQANESHADNRPTATRTSVQITLWSSDPVKIQSADANLKALLIPAGFLRAGGRNLPFSQKTGYYGYASTYNHHEMEG